MSEIGALAVTIRHFQLTIRRFLIIIALVAVAMASYEWRKLARVREGRQVNLILHVKEERDLRQILKSIHEGGDDLIKEDPTIPAYEEYTRRRMKHEAEMVRRYRRLADHPWELTPPAAAVPRPF